MTYTRQQIIIEADRSTPTATREDAVALLLSCRNDLGGTDVTVDFTKGEPWGLYGEFLDGLIRRAFRLDETGRVGSAHSLTVVLGMATDISGVLSALSVHADRVKWHAGDDPSYVVIEATDESDVDLDDNDDDSFGLEEDVPSSFLNLQYATGDGLYREAARLAQQVHDRITGSPELHDIKTEILQKQAELYLQMAAIQYRINGE